MTHRNARLTAVTRLELVHQVGHGWAVSEVARQFRVSRSTAYKWVWRYQHGGAAALEDRPSRPKTCPRRTSQRLEDTICAVRRKEGWGPHRIAWALKVARSTVYAVLKRHGISRLDHLHRVTRRAVRYERNAAGDLLHLDVKKLGRVPDGGGKRFAPGFRETKSGPRSGRSLGVDYLHVAVDDHSRYAYVEALPDERGSTTAGFLERALAYYEARGVQVRELLTDNAMNYTASKAFLDVAQTHGLRRRTTRPYRPQTNGKAERFIQTLQNEWAYARPYSSDVRRRRALPRWLYRYNNRRPHSAIQGLVPAARL
jgi:transposase InsO family protein